MKKEICKTDEVQYEEVAEVQLTEKEKKKLLLWKRVGAIVHIFFLVGLLVGLYLHFEKNWVYTIAAYVVGYYSFLLLISLIPNLGEVFYPKYRQTWNGRNFVWIEDPDYSKRYGFFELIKNFVFYALIIVLGVGLLLPFLPQYLLVIVFFAAFAFVLLQTLIFPLLKDLLAIISCRKILKFAEKVQTITYRTIILTAVALVIVLQFVYPLYTKPKMDLVKVLNQKSPYYTQELLEKAEVTYDYSHVATECEINYVGKINANNMILDTKTYAKLTFDLVDAVWETKSNPNHKILSDITVEKGKPAVFTGTREIDIKGFEGEGIVTVKLTDVKNGAGSGTLEIRTSNNKKLLYSSKFTIEEEWTLDVMAYTATLKKPMKLSESLSVYSMDMQIDISKKTFTFFDWNFTF